MRIFKFRAWHGEDKVMVYDLNSLRLFHGILQPDDYELMQFTGLQDKNGKDIFEGDIVKHNKTYTDKRDVFALIELSAYDDDEGYSTISHLGWHIGDHSLIDWASECEIVGNIYENPELLKEIK